MAFDCERRSSKGSRDFFIFVLCISDHYIYLSGTAPRERPKEARETVDIVLSSHLISSHRSWSRKLAMGSKYLLGKQTVKNPFCWTLISRTLHG
jgi:hypothetical protein